MGNIEKYNATLTPEQRKANSQRAVRAFQESAKRRKEEQLQLAKCAPTLYEAAQAIAAGDVGGFTKAFEMMQSIADIATNSKSEDTRIKAANLFADITGQKAAQHIKLETTNTNIESMDLSQLSDTDLTKLLHKVQAVKAIDIDDSCTDVVTDDTDTL